MRPENRASGQRSGSFTEQARRAQITAGAIDVLSAEGYTATSLAAIADRLGISKGVISYHFAGKAELLQEVVRSVLAAAEAWMTPRIAGSTSFTGAMRSYIAANLSFIDAHRRELFALTEVLANSRTSEGIPEIFGASQHEAVNALESLIARGQAAGEFGETSPTVVAMSLRASIDAVTGVLRENPEFDLTAFAAELTALFERAIRK